MITTTMLLVQTSHVLHNDQLLPESWRGIVGWIEVAGFMVAFNPGKEG